MSERPSDRHAVEAILKELQEYPAGSYMRCGFCGTKHANDHSEKCLVNRLTAALAAASSIELTTAPNGNAPDIYRTLGMEGVVVNGTAYSPTTLIGALAIELHAARSAIAEKRWAFGVEHGWPSLTRQIHPEDKLLGWRMPSQTPPEGQLFDPANYPYYETAEEAIDAAMARADGAAGEKHG